MSPQYTQPPRYTRFRSTVLGTPRIGPNRELKKAVEAYWAGRSDHAAPDRVREELRRDTWRRLLDAGLDSVPVNTHALYDQVLDATVLLGALPARHTVSPSGEKLSDLDAYFAAARGTAGVAPLEMTKWFDTNYHYLVPEIGPEIEFSLNAGALLAEVRDAISRGVPARPVLIGPFTYLALSKTTVEGIDPLSRLGDILPLYVELLGLLADAGAEWVQLDEPALVCDRTETELDAARRALAVLGGAEKRPAILVATYFGAPGEALPVLADAPVEALALDLVAGTLPVDVPAGLRDKLLVAGVVDGRNIWRTDLDAALAALGAARGIAGDVAVSTSCSLLHVPYSLSAETALLERDPALASWLAFGAEKIAEVTALRRALSAHADAIAGALEASREALRSRAADPRVRVPAVRDRVAALTDADARRTPYAERRPAQDAAVPLPPVPTTTIGSFPQTTSLRVARRELRDGLIDAAGYEQRMRSEIVEVIRLQEDIGLDVLVHGEPERNDMVQYFAEQLAGYAATENGWVQSYGSRCVRPPILFGDVSRPEPMTVGWSGYAQSLTERPVKGMLTGPVTMLAWAFVREDLPIAETAAQVALAIRDEVADLEAAGIRIVQVDEPALRELLPLRKAEQGAYLDWSVWSFRLATAGVADATAIHTHMCYSEFGELIGSIADLDADVTSIEAARSDMEIVADLDHAGFDLGIGPGVYDIHSPRVPGVAEMADALRAAARLIPGDRLWANPDCGLKTRRDEESTPSLRNLVEAAREVRAEITTRI